jgi:hypothetical protein
MSTEMQGMNMTMDITPAPGHVHSSDAIAHFSVAMDHYLPNEDATVTILIQNQWDRPIDKFDRVHEQLLHLIVVSKDLSYFRHIHPEYKGDGRFEITTSFPSGGDYQLIADFTPTGMGQTVQSHWVHIGGSERKTEELKADHNPLKMVSGYEVALSFDHLMAGMGLTMKFSIRDAATKQPITDLQPYLGSLGHAVAISADGADYVHVHPNDPQGSGPDAAFTIAFPNSGLYRIWGQFQRHNEVITVPFTVNVP